MRILTVILALAALCGCGGKQEQPIDLLAREVTFPNGTKITAVPAQTQLEVLQGLRYYDTLAPDRGMLFIYAKPEPHPFWMYQAKFPVDIIWVDRDFKIIEMSLNTQPCNTAAHDCPTYGGQHDSRYVLEIKAGIAAQNNLRIGDRLEF